MLCKKTFMRSYGLLLTGKGIPMDTTAARLTYESFKNDFTDEEFQAVCLRIFKSENFYGRVPDASLFTKYKPVPAEQSDFIDKCSVYLQSDYVSQRTKSEFDAGLTFAERRTLSGFGGISTLWTSCHPCGVFSPERFEAKIKELRDHFKEIGVLSTPKPMSQLIENKQAKIKAG